MAFNKKTTEATTDNKKTWTYRVEVTSVRSLEDRDDIVFFNANVNGIEIKDMKFIFYKTKEGNEGSMVRFPSEKYTNKKGEENYSNFCWFPVSAELKEEILTQIESLLG